MQDNFNKTALDNGIRIVSKRVPHARSVAMGVWVNVGARDERPEESGLSHFIEHMIFKGTEKRTAVQIAKEFDAIGGQSNAFTSKENTCYHAKVMDAYLNTMVDLLTDIFLNSVFDAQEVERERQVVLQEIRMLEDSPDEYVHVLLAQSVWGNHPLGRPILGSPKTVARFNSATAKEYFSRLYQPERIVIAAAGNLEHDSFAELVAQSFEVVGKADGFPERIVPDMNRVISVHPKDLEQVHVCIGAKGVHATDPRRYACAVLNTILGGNMSSRLFQEIRERRGLAYAVYSFLSLYSDTGTWGAYVGVDNSNTEQVVEVIAREMKRAKDEPVDSSELTNAKQYLKGGLYLGAESTDNQMTRIAQNEITFGRFVPLKEVEDKVEEVTAEQILEVAREIFQNDRVSLTLLGPVDRDASYEEALSL
ncbi:MAG: insulinase family protein [Deltaproteobacteria bacterium]|nr:insulinase family protein [Deltaproteobacteria bacterium]